MTTRAYTDKEELEQRMQTYASARSMMFPHHGAQLADPVMSTSILGAIHRRIQRRDHWGFASWESESGQVVVLISGAASPDWTAPIAGHEPRATRQQVPNDRQLKGIAEADPDQLVELLQAEIHPGDLARCASAAYFVQDRSKVRNLLVSLARSHRSPIVREACLQGLSNENHSSVVELFRYLSTSDMNPSVREVAQEILKELEEEGEG
jgi:hypothetical protein